MTAASYTSGAFAPSSSSRVGWRRVLVALLVCLPVPACAASGLSLPLPATVERIAAALVPWVDAMPISANEALREGAHGSIVLNATEGGDGTARLAAVVTPARVGARRRARVGVPRPGLLAAPSARDTLGPNGSNLLSAGAPPTAKTAGAAAVDGSRLQPTSDAESASQTTEAAAPAPAPPTSTTPTEPASDPVAPVTNAVDEAVAPVSPVVEQTTTTVEEVVTPVTELLPGLGK